MAAFASDRRSGWVRVLVLILCALFIFATIATPPAYAVGETVALFGLAAVLSAATAALGFKLSSNAEGQATLQKMVQDFTGASIAAGLVLTGTKVNGLINGMQYIKMAVHNGKTYLDERIFAWCQKWLANNGVYNSGSLTLQDYSNLVGKKIEFPNIDISYYYSFFPSDAQSKFKSIVQKYNLDLNGRVVELGYNNNTKLASLSYSRQPWSYYLNLDCYFTVKYHGYYDVYVADYGHPNNGAPSIIDAGSYSTTDGIHFDGASYGYSVGSNAFLSFSTDSTGISRLSNIASGNVVSNDTGLSGTDTLGKDVIDLTLDQILDRLKEWAQDWFDAGADSVTNAATGAKDLPLSVATGAATLNPDVAENGPLVYFPTFGWSLPKLRSGETDTKTVDQGKENASAAETSVDVAENQTVVDSLVNWALGYISPDTGLFSKFPLCIPYDAYLLACSALGVSVVGSDSIFGASPDDLSSIVQTGDEQSEGFTPVITISNDLTIDGYTYPLDLTIDLTDWTPIIKFVRLCISLTVIAELVGAEYKRIKGK